MTMTRKDRILKTIYRKRDLDRLPTQFDFAPRALDRLTAHLGVAAGEENLLDVLNNHIAYCYINDFFGKLRRRTGLTARIMYDNFNVGFDTAQEGLFFCDHPLADLDAWKGYKFPDPGEDSLMDITREVVGKFKGEYLTASYQVTCLFERAYSLRGLENFLVDLYINRDFAEELLEKITLYQMEIAKRYIAEGVDCGRTGHDYGSQKGMLFSAELWREMFKPRLKRIWDVYKNAGLPVIYHSCGDFRDIIPDFIEMGLDVLHPVQPQAMPIEELAVYTGRLTFYGGLSNQITLPFGTPEDVDAEVKRTIAVLGKNNGFILAPSNGITTDTPLENILAMLEAAKKYCTRG